MTIEIFSKAAKTKSAPKIAFPAQMQLKDHLREMSRDANGHRIYEFMGTDSFGAEWQQRQRFEVNAGRDEEPILYTPLYDVVSDASLPKNVDVNTMGPGGVVFEEVFEGGEVKFSSISSGEYTVPIRHWATGLEYSKDLVIYNSLWNVPIIERQMGVAHNALLNHLHISPILTYTYAAANQTAAVTSGATTTEDWLLTIEAGIAASKSDTSNPRRGPYILIIAGADEFMVERALQRVSQQGVSLQANSAMSAIRSVIVYDGWSGTRGNKTVSYSGVTAGKGYLVSQQYRGQDYISFEKQALQNGGMQEDISRFLTQSVWDSYYGVYANPLRTVEEITFPS
jgi:hypothetical protein